MRRSCSASSGLLCFVLSWAPLPTAGAEFYPVGNSPIERDAMIEERVYQGHRLRLSAMHAPDGSWTGTAEFLDEQQPPVAVKGFASGEQALEGALSQAMAKIDVGRRLRGKP